MFDVMDFARTRGIARAAGLVAIVFIASQCTMPVGDVPGFHQVFTDDFDINVPVGGFSGCKMTQNIVDSVCPGLPPIERAKWTAYPDGWKDTSRNGTYMASKTVSMHDGVMDIHLHSENGVPLVAAPMPKIPGGPGTRGGAAYGKFMVRFWADPIHRYKVSWMLWPDSGLRADGEIDFPEGNLDSTMWAFMHRQGSVDAVDQDVYGPLTGFNGWHVASMAWTPNSLYFYLDGKTIGRSTVRVPNTPMHWVLQTESALNGQVPQPTDDGHVLIDWVVAYEST
jgi:hypothetical protein